MLSETKTQGTSLNLLAPNGIVQVTFAGLIDSDQYVELRHVVLQATSARSLSDELMALGRKWGIETTARRTR